uniref:Uncharacterized protein n=1 Tax=Rhizophora mucronata TaxID=61149 RepID=A0A2P2IQ94_RHIMU
MSTNMYYIYLYVLPACILFRFFPFILSCSKVIIGFRSTLKRIITFRVLIFCLIALFSLG